MTEKRINEIIDLIAVSEKIISNPLTSSEEKEKRRLLIGALVDSVLDEGGPELFFKMEEKILEKLKNFQYNINIKLITIKNSLL